MIVSDAGFIIATPTKCGTTTLEEMCRRHRGGRKGTPKENFRIMDWAKPRRQHSMAMDVSLRNYQRFMMVRNPYDRWCSIYEYLRAPHNYTKWGAKQIQGAEWRGTWHYHDPERTRRPMTFGEFLEFIIRERKEYSGQRWSNRRGDFDDPFHYRSPWVWLDPLDQQLRKLRRQPGEEVQEVVTLRLESFWENMSWLKFRFPSELADLSVKPSIHANRCLTYAGAFPAHARFWGGLDLCRAHLVRRREVLSGWLPSRCGECVGCRMRVDVEANTLGFNQAYVGVRLLHHMFTETGLTT